MKFGDFTRNRNTDTIKTTPLEFLPEVVLSPFFPVTVEPFKIAKMSPTTTSARDSLTSRVLPQMVLSDGSPTSLTAAPAPIPRDTPPAHSARYRFEVTGTAMYFIPPALFFRAC